MFLATFAGGAGLYLLLCAATALAGRGLLRLGRARVGVAEWPLAAVLGSLFWALALGVAVGLRAPVRAVAPWLGGATLLLAAAGLWRPWAALRHGGLLAAACALLPAATLAPTFRAGLTSTTETVASDGWAYMATAEYFRDVPRGEPGGPAPVHRYGSVLAEARYVGFCLLALVGPLLAPVDGFGGVALLQAWSLFVTACAVLLFWLAQGWRPRAALALAALTATGGWMFDVAWCNNLDQGLSLAYMPALAAVPALFGPRDWRRWALLGALAAGLLYTYPELAPFELAGAGLIALPRLGRERGAWRAWLAGGAAAAAAAALLLLPARTMLVEFARLQFESATKGPRPGGDLCDGLRRPAQLPSGLWGLGGETAAKPSGPPQTAYAAGLTLLAALGLGPLVRRGQWGVVLAYLLLGAAALAVLLAHHFSYGSYKILSATWWLAAAAAFAGGERLLAKVPGPGRRAGCAGAAVAAALLLNLGFGRAAAPLWHGHYDGAPAAEFRPVREAGRLAGGRPLLLAVDDWKANLLALFYLRDAPLYLPAYRSHLSGMHVQLGVLEEQAVALSDVRYVLSDDRPESLAWQSAAGPPVWAGGHYRLWEVAPRRGEARLLYAEGYCEPMHQLEQRGGRPFLSLGDRPTTVYVYAARAGRLRLRGEWLPGPGQSSSRLEVLGPLGDRQEVDVAAGEIALAVPVPAGVSRLKARLLALPGADEPSPRLGASLLAVELAPQGAPPAR
jgi:hypothetical protein